MCKGLGGVRGWEVLAGRRGWEVQGVVWWEGVGGVERGGAGGWEVEGWGSLRLRGGGGRYNGCIFKLSAECYIAFGP